MSQVTQLSAAEVIKTCKCFRETFIVPSSNTNITFSRKYNKVLGLNIERMVYVTASNYNYCMLLYASGYGNEHRFVSSVNGNTQSVPYSKMFLIGTTSSTEVDYESPSGSMDVITAYGSQIYQFNMQLTITGVGSNIGANSTDITGSNPVFMEFAIYTQDENI